MEILLLLYWLFGFSFGVIAGFLAYEYIITRKTKYASKGLTQGANARR